MESMKKRLLAKAFNRGSWEIPSVPRTFSSSPIKREKSLEIINPFRVVESPLSIERAQPVRAPRVSVPAKQVSEDFPVEEVSDDLLPEEKPEEPRSKKPVAFLILENYIRELCVEIEKNSYACRETLLRAKKIIHALNDCTKEIPNLSIYFYNLARSILKELSSMKENDDYQSVLHKLLELAAFISENRYESNEQPVSKYSIYLEKSSDESAKSALEKRMKNLNPRNINLIGRVISEDLELKKVVKAYLILLEELDPLLLYACKGLDPVSAMHKLSQTPNRVYKLTQTTLNKFESLEISIHAMERMKEVLETVNFRRLKQKERSGVGVILYEFLTYCAKFNSNEPVQTDTQKTVEKPRRKSLKVSDERASVSKQIVSSVVARRSNTPKARPKPNTRFHDPVKQKLFEAIVHQQRVNVKFRQFLKEYLKTCKISLRDRNSIVDAFASEMKIKTAECDRFKVLKVFKENLEIVRNN